jgi:hypothetical protein
LVFLVFVSSDYFNVLNGVAESPQQLNCTTDCSFLSTSQTTILNLQILFYAAIPSAFQVSFEVKAVSLGSPELALNLIDICDDDGNSVLSVVLSYSRELLVRFMDDTLSADNSGPEIASNYTTEWTSVTVSLRDGLLSFWTVADVQSSIFQYDVSTITEWLSCDLCQFYASGQSDTGASGYIRNIRIAGAIFSLYI